MVAAMANRSGDPVQGELFQTCAICGGERVYLPHEVAPVEVMRLPDGRVLLCLWDGRRKSVWIEMPVEGRRWLATELVRDLDAEAGDPAPGCVS